MKRKIITEKDIIGRLCVNCNSEDDISYHHIVPLAIGGNDVVSNYTCLCFTCHAKLHMLIDCNGRINHSELIKNGLKNARAKGHIPGRKKTTIDDIPQSFFRYYPQFANGTINLSEFSRLANLSRTSIYKYLKIVENH